jgi:BatD DUF11 like domain
MSDGFSRGLILFWAACLFVTDACAASFTASLDRDTIRLGEQATLSLAFEGGSPKNAPVPDVPGLRIVNSGNSQNFSFVNGQMSSTVTITYSIAPERTGEFIIPAMSVDVGGQRLTSQPVKLTVLQAGAPPPAAVNSGNEVAFIRLSLPQQKIYAGETLTGELRIYLRDDVQNFGNFQFTATPADGFAIGKSSEGGRFRTQVGNRIYTVVPVTLALTARKAGTLTLGPFTASMVVVLPSSNGGDSFFQQFFNAGQQRRVSMATEQVAAQALPLPDQNVPANFSGAVGDYTLAVTAGPTNVAVGDPITVRVQIAGRGALDALKLPDFSGWKDFKLFPPTVKTDFSDQLHVEGTKTFEEIVTPEDPDVHALPEISFSFFNPADGKYHTLTQPSEPLVVRSAGATPLPTLAASPNSANENQKREDILPIKGNLGTLAQAAAPLVTRPVFLAVQSLPVLAFLGALVWRKRADRLANNPRLRRQRAVSQLIASGMDDLKKYAAANQPDEFFATLFRLLQEQLGERLDCPASSITENVVEEHSVLRGTPPETREALRELFQLCNQARYAPVRGSSELNSVAARFERVVGELQELKA